MHDQAGHAVDGPKVAAPSVGVKFPSNSNLYVGVDGVEAWEEDGKEMIAIESDAAINPGMSFLNCEATLEV